MQSEFTFDDLPQVFKDRIVAFRSGRVSVNEDYDAYEVAVSIEAMRLAGWASIQGLPLSGVDFSKSPFILTNPTWYTQSLVVTLAVLYLTDHPTLLGFHSSVCHLVGCREAGHIIKAANS